MALGYLFVSFFLHPTLELHEQPCGISFTPPFVLCNPFLGTFANAVLTA